MVNGKRYPQGFLRQFIPSSSTRAKHGMSAQPQRTTPPAHYLKSSTPRTPKATTTSVPGTQSTRTRINNPSKATNTNGCQLPPPRHTHPYPPPLTWTHTTLPYGRRYSYNRTQTLTHKATYNNASSPSQPPMHPTTRSTTHPHSRPPGPCSRYHKTYLCQPNTPYT